MSPGTMTGWPGKARVAPLRCTSRRRRRPSTSCSSSLAMLWATSYTDASPSSPRPHAEHALEYLTGRVGQHLPVGEREIRRRAHRTQVVDRLGGVDRRAGELAIGHGDAVPPERRAGHRQIVRAHLMAQAPRAGVDHDRERAEPHAQVVRHGARRGSRRRSAARGSGCRSRASPAGGCPARARGPRPHRSGHPAAARPIRFARDRRARRGRGSPPTLPPAPGPPSALSSTATLSIERRRRSGSPRTARPPAPAAAASRRLPPGRCAAAARRS